MGSEVYEESMNLKVSELLKEVQLDYSPATTKTIDDVVSSIKEAINKIPEDLLVSSPPSLNLTTFAIRSVNSVLNFSVYTCLLLRFLGYG